MIGACGAMAPFAGRCDDERHGTLFSHREEVAPSVIFLGGENHASPRKAPCGRPRDNSKSEELPGLTKNARGNEAKM